MDEIFSYLNYREFLRDYLSHKSKQDRSFTQRELLAKMNVSSTGFLANVMSGKKNLNEKMTEDLSHLLELRQRERNCFVYMVNYNQAKTIESKKMWFDKLTGLKQVKGKLLERNQLTLFSKWYYVYIRDMLNYFECDNNYRDLALALEPSITAVEAERAVNALAEMNLIVQDEHGYWRPVDSSVSTGDEVASLLLANFQLKTMELGRRALEKIRAKHRDISVLSMTLSKESFLQVKKEVQEFRKRLLHIADSEDKADSVYQCNIQLFPVTKLKDDSHE